MKGLSVIIFSRNYPERTIGAIKDIYDYVDEIVLVDSSDSKERKELLKSKKDNVWKKLNIYYIVPMGFVELYRGYAISKCSKDWILYLDTDERVSEKLKKDLRKITRTSKCSAYNIVRYEDVTSDVDYRNFTFQIRLFMKSKIKYKGIIDERPQIMGRLCRFNDRAYYMGHILEQMQHQSNEYYKPENKFSRYELISYYDYNAKILSYIARVRGIKEEDIMSRMSAKFIKSILGVYEKVTFRKLDQEISTLDYFSFAFIRLFGLSYKQGNWRGMLKAFPMALKNATMHLKYKLESNHIQTYKISRIINDIGMIKFLGLDNDETIKSLNEKYKDSKLAGLGLLAHLLEQRYSAMKRNGRYP